MPNDAKGAVSLLIRCLHSAEPDIERPQAYSHFEPPNGHLAGSVVVDRLTCGPAHLEDGADIIKAWEYQRPF